MQLSFSRQKIKVYVPTVVQCIQFTVLSKASSPRYVKYLLSIYGAYISNGKFQSCVQSSTKLMSCVNRHFTFLHCFLAITVDLP